MQGLLFETIKKILYEGKSVLSNFLYILFKILFSSCFCASCIKRRFQVNISIANSSNQRNRLPNEQISLMYRLFLNSLYSAFSILQCICELCEPYTPAYLRHCCEDGYENISLKVLVVFANFTNE